MSIPISATIVALGPLTNIADALDREYEIDRLIARVAPSQSEAARTEAHLAKLLGYHLESCM